MISLLTYWYKYTGLGGAWRMNTLIVYGSKYGTTKKCAEMLQKELEGDVQLVNIREKNDIDIRKYETVIIGSPVYLGEIDKGIKKFCYQNIERLRDKNIGLFICCMNPQESEKQIKQNFPKPLLDRAMVREDFGGEFLMEKMSLAERWAIRAVAKTLARKDPNFSSQNKRKISLIRVDNIKKFARQINRCS
jgi:menaquinone-dependent protoporphyrinogen oxidase